MSMEEKDEHLVRCLLCGDLCWFDDRGAHRAGGWALVLFGWVLPVFGADRLGGTEAETMVFFLVTGALWLAAVIYLFLKQTVWVCRTCGVHYPARCVPQGVDAPREGDATDENHYE